MFFNKYLLVIGKMHLALPIIYTISMFIIISWKK